MSINLQRLARTAVAKPATTLARLPLNPGRGLASATSAVPRFTGTHFARRGNHFLPGGRRMAQLGAMGLALGAAQYYFGTAEDFFDESFVTRKKSEDLADFYGTEDFMEVFCVFPFMVNFMMRGAQFDDEGNIHAWGLLGPGELEITINFDEKEVDTNGDGEPDTLVWFNKKEHFHDRAPDFLGGFTLWEMTQNFGYHRKDDGTSVVYHHGDKFQGFFPVRFIFQLHAKYVIWATQKYINSDDFGTEDHEDQLEEQRQNIPLHVFKSFLVGLTRDAERIKRDPRTDETKKSQLEVTIQRLNTLSKSLDEDAVGEENGSNKIIPRLRTLKSHRSNVAHVHLMMDDAEAKDTIRTAVEQIGSSSGQRNGPTAEMKTMVRRTSTINLQRKRES